MTSSEIESHLRRGAAEWNRWRDKYGLDTIDLSGISVDHADLRGAELSGVNFAGAELNGARLDRANLRGANFAGATLRHAHFVDADLASAVMSYAELTGAQFTRADLRDTDFREAELADTRWNGARMSKKTKLSRMRFDPSHNAFVDGSESIVFPKRDQVLNWGLIRVAGALPLFEVSYIGVTGAILLITTIGYVNSTGFLEMLEYPIPLPERVLWLLLSSFLLFLGSSMYRLLCPQRVQEFSETQWVEQHGRPRLQYLSASHERKWQLSTFVLIASGGALGLILLFERFYVAFEYVMAELQR